MRTTIRSRTRSRCTSTDSARRWIPATPSHSFTRAEGLATFCRQGERSKRRLPPHGRRRGARRPTTFRVRMKTATSIRTRLSAWYAGAFALLLSIFALGAYAFLEHTTQERIDEYLAETVGAVAGAMEYERVSGRPFDEIIDD